MEYEIKSQTRVGVKFNIINFIVGRISVGGMEGDTLLHLCLGLIWRIL